jgi:hypothetical protein
VDNLLKAVEKSDFAEAIHSPPETLSFCAKAVDKSGLFPAVSQRRPDSADFSTLINRARHKAWKTEKTSSTCI